MGRAGFVEDGGHGDPGGKAPAGVAELVVGNAFHAVLGPLA